VEVLTVLTWKHLTEPAGSVGGFNHFSAPADHITITAITKILFGTLTPSSLRAKRAR
jgi:hypothetical protein